MSSNITIRKANIADVPFLLPLAKAIFSRTYAHLNRPENMENYLAKAFTHEQFVAEFSNPSSHFYLASLGESLVGYTKLNFGPAQTELQDDRAIEVERIYVFADHQGKGIGRQLIEHSKTVALAHQLDYIWLGVWKRNPAAIAFYKRMGFFAFDEHVFQFGEEAQIDVMMRLSLY